MKTTIPFLEKFGIESFKTSKRKKNKILELLGIRNYDLKKKTRIFIVVG